MKCRVPLSPSVSPVWKQESLAQQTHRGDGGGSIMLVFSLHPPIYQRLQISHLPLSRESTHPPFKLTHPPHASTRRTSTTRRRCRECRRERQSAGSAGRDAGRKRMKAWVCPPACSSRRLSDTENTFQTEGESGGGGAASRSSYSSQRPITALACAGDVINSLA